MRNYILLFLSCSSLCLAGCTTPNGPIGQGYTNFDQPYKSAPGNKAASIGYDYSEEKNSKNMDEIQIASRDLVDSLVTKIPGDQRNIYLTTAGSTAFYMSFDHTLRKELTDRGYQLALTPSHAVNVKFTANQPMNNSTNTNSSRDTNQELFLALVDGKNVLASGIYDVPAYAFKEGNVEIVEPAAGATDVQTNAEPKKITPPACQVGDVLDDEHS